MAGTNREEQQGAKALPKASLSDEGIQAKIAARKQAAEWVRHFLSKPLVYEVVYAEGAPVRAVPSEGAEEVACVPKGSTVEGFCGQDWLLIQSNSTPPRQPSVAGNWAFIGARLRASCLRIRVQRRFSEALDIRWEGLDVSETWRVQYGLKWRAGHSTADEESAPAASSTSRAPRHNISTRPEGTISGLLPGQSMRFSVVAQLSLPGGGRPQKITGPWSAAYLCPELDLCLQGSMDACADSSGKLRGGCADSACSAWVASREFENRCARCGAKAEDHELVSVTKVQLLAPEVALTWPPLQYFCVEREVDILDWPSERSGVLGHLNGKGLTVAGYKYGDWVQLEIDGIPSWLLPEPSGDGGNLWIRCGAGAEADSGVVASVKAPIPAVKNSNGDHRLLALSPLPASTPESVVAADPKSPAMIMICGHSSSPWLTELLALHSEISVVSQIDFVANAAKAVLDGHLDFPAFRKQVLRLASQSADLDEPEQPPWIHGDEAYVPRPSLGLEFVLQATHSFLDAVRSGRPRLPALSRLVAELVAEYLRQDSSRPMVVWEPPDSPQVLPLLGAVCPRAKVVHCVVDGRGVARSSGSCPPDQSMFKHISGKAQAWTEAVESVVSWGMANPDRYIEVRSEDMARHPRRELSRILSWLGVSTSGEDDAWELLKRRRKEANPKREDDGNPGSLDSPRLRRIFEGRTGSALQHFGYVGNDASAANGRPELQDEELNVDGEAGTIVQGKMIFKKTLDLQAKPISPSRDSDSPAWATSPSGGSLLPRRATTGTLGTGTRTPPGITRTPRAVARSGMRTPPGIQRGSDTPTGLQKATTTTFGADCSEELASILQRRLDRAEPKRGPSKSSA